MGDVGLRLCDLRAHPRAGRQRNLKGHADLFVVLLELGEECGVVVELGQQGVLRYQVHARQPLRFHAAHFQFLGGDLRFQPAQVLIGVERGLRGLLLRFRQRRRGPLFGHGVDAVLGGEAQCHGESGFRVGDVVVQQFGGLARVRQVGGGYLLG